MATTIKQKNEKTGVEEDVVVVPQKEVEEKIAAEKAALEESHKKIIEEKETSLKNLAQEKIDLENKIKAAELAGIKEDHPNFKILKEALTKKDVEIDTLNKKFDEEKKSRQQEAIDNQIKLAAKGNVELEKKIRLHLKETLGALPEDTAEQREKKLQAALKLSSDSSSGPGIFDGGTGGGGMGSGSIKEGDVNGVEFTAREKALGAKLGIKDEDYKKYGSRLSKK